MVLQRYFTIIGLVIDASYDLAAIVLVQERPQVVVLIQASCTENSHHSLLDLWSIDLYCAGTHMLRNPVCVFYV
jgi:hypothetical protein